MNKLKYIILIVFFFFGDKLFARDGKFVMPEHISKETVLYAVKGTDSLYMDIYRLKESGDKVQPVVMFQFGGSFQTGWRDRDFYGPYLQAVTEMGFTAVSFDYRLGMADKKYNLKTMAAKKNGLSDAVQLAVEDLFTATNYLLLHSERLHVRQDSILASGSSAGAISVLQADWIVKSRLNGSEVLPEGFSYMGIISFAGGIFSHTGGPKYKYGNPAPTLLFHGSKDKMVPYYTIRFSDTGIFTSKNLRRRIRKTGADYVYVKLKGKDHYYGAEDVMTEGLFITKWFLDEFIRQGNGRQIELKIGKGFSLRSEKPSKRVLSDDR